MRSRKSSLFYKIFLVLFEIGFGIQLHVIGSISISEMFLVVYTGIFIWNDNLFSIKEFKLISLFYALLLFTQILTEMAVGNIFSNSLKGIAVTIVSFCHLYFLIKCFKKERSLVFWLLLGLIIKSIFFKTDIALEADPEDTERAAYLKFYLSPILLSIGLLISLKLSPRISSIIYLIGGAFLIVYGARSSGVTVLLTGLIVFILNLKKRTFKTHVKYYIIPVLLLAYGGYVYYVNEVKKGDITFGNSEQIISIKNPYNPLNLLMIGRSEAFVGWQAFMDKPLTGHGAWKSDADYAYKYHMLQSYISDSKYNIAAFSQDVIPCHSVVIGYAMQNGIFALAFILAILCIFVRFGLYTMQINDKYIILTTYLLLSMLWDALFSPISHFRAIMPLAMAFFFVTSLLCHARSLCTCNSVRNE